MPEWDAGKLGPARAAALALIERIDPEFASVARRVYQADDQGGEGLSARERAVIEMVVYGNVSYYESSHLEEAMRRALGAGASREQLVKVVELTAVMGYHGVAMAIPALRESLTTAQALPSFGSVPAETRSNIDDVMVDEWVHSRPTMREFAQVSPRLADLMVDWTRVAWFSDVLERKLKELIYLAFDATPTHIFLPGLAGHVYRALDGGATPFEVAQVLEITLTPSIDRVSESFRLIESAIADSGEPS